MIGIKKDDVLDPFLKDPIHYENDSVKCQSIPNIGIVLCENKSQTHYILSMIFSIIIVVSTAMFFTLNITITFPSSEIVFDSLYTYFDSIFIVFLSLIIGYMISKKKL